MWNLLATAAAMLMLIPAILGATRLAGEYAGDAAVCHQLATTAALRDAALSYVVANHTSLGIATGATATLAPSVLTAAGSLTAGWQDLGPGDTTHAVRIHNNGGGYDVLTLTHGGNQLDERRLRASASCAAQGVAYVDADSPTEIISASQGERVAASTFASGATPIEAGRLMFLDHVGAGQVVPPYLHRYEVPGTDANRMFTAVDMNGNDVDTAGTVTAVTVDTDTLNAGTATVTGNAAIGGTATIGGDTSIGGALTGTSATFSNSVIATDYYFLSDRRAKTDIHDITCKPRDQLLSLVPKSYRWRSNGEHKVSYIAQDVQAILPEFVRTDPQRRLVVRQSELNIYMMHCLLRPTLFQQAGKSAAVQTCPATQIRVVGTRQHRGSPIHQWPAFPVSIPRLEPGTGAWAEISGPTMRDYCPRLWVACLEGERAYTCRRSDHSVATYPVERPLQAEGGPS